MSCIVLCRRHERFGVVLLAEAISMQGRDFTVLMLVGVEFEADADSSSPVSVRSRQARVATVSDEM